MLWSIWRSQCFEADNGGGEGGGNSQSGDANPGGDKGTGKGDEKGGESKEFKAITSQEEFDAALKERLARHEKTISKKLADDIRKQLQDEADAKSKQEQGDYKSLFEAEKAKREAAEKERDAERLAALRSRIAAKHKLPGELADRITGTTEDEIETDAKALAKIVGPRPAPDTEAGSGAANNARNGGQPPKRAKQDGPVYTFDGKQKVAWPDRA